MSFITLAEVPEKLRQLTPETKPLWGYMTAQHMVEHIALSLLTATGKFNLTANLTPEQRERQLQWLAGTEPLAKGLQFRGLAAGELLPLRFNSLQAAIENFELVMATFHTLYQQKPLHTAVHPRFGELNYEQWIRFQQKHLTHHLKQFGLLND